MLMKLSTPRPPVGLLLRALHASAKRCLMLSVLCHHTQD
jgi:hypothetical protein